jgi:hypothetical protein
MNLNCIDLLHVVVVDIGLRLQLLGRRGGSLVAVVSIRSNNVRRLALAFGGSLRASALGLRSGALAGGLGGGRSRSTIASGSVAVASAVTLLLAQLLEMLSSQGC